MIFAAKFWGYFIVVAVIGVICALTYVARKVFKIGTFTKEEEANMKSNLDLLLQEEDKEEGKDYRDEV